MLATATLGSLKDKWCGSIRRMKLLIGVYVCVIAVPHFLVALYYVLPRERDYDPAAWSNYAWALALWAFVRFLDLGYGPGFVFWRCWTAATHRGGGPPDVCAPAEGNSDRSVDTLE